MCSLSFEWPIPKEVGASVIKCKRRKSKHLRRTYVCAYKRTHGTV